MIHGVHHSESYTRWLDSHAVADDCMARAYEAQGGQGRAILKKCIARLHMLWGEHPARERCSRQFARDFCLESDQNPAPYALVCCPADYAQPAALLAAVMPAVLAGVREVLPCLLLPDGWSEDFSPDCEQQAAPLLAAMELAGVERVFYATPQDAADLLDILGAMCTDGRLVLLGKSQGGSLLAAKAHEAGLNCRSLVRPLLYYNHRQCCIAELSFDTGANNGAPAADTTGGEFDYPPEDQIFLHLDSAHEDIWVWPDVSPAWFRTTHMRLFSHCSLN